MFVLSFSPTDMESLRRECQKTHWKQHKRVCGEKFNDPGYVEGTPVARTPTNPGASNSGSGRQARFPLPVNGYQRSLDLLRQIATLSEEGFADAFYVLLDEDAGGPPRTTRVAPIREADLPPADLAFYCYAREKAFVCGDWSAVVVLW